jgi:hypothetical protein
MTTWLTSIPSDFMLSIPAATDALTAPTSPHSSKYFGLAVQLDMGGKTGPDDSQLFDLLNRSHGISVIFFVMGDNRPWTSASLVALSPVGAWFRTACPEFGQGRGDIGLFAENGQHLGVLGTAALHQAHGAPFGALHGQAFLSAQIGQQQAQKSLLGSLDEFDSHAMNRLICFADATLTQRRQAGPGAAHVILDPAAADPDAADD